MDVRPAANQPWKSNYLSWNHMLIYHTELTAIFVSCTQTILIQVFGIPGNESGRRGPRAPS